MAFTEYKAKEITRKRVEPTEVRVAVSGKKSLSISIIIGSELLKTCGFTIGEKVALYFGTAEDKGKVLIKKASYGSALLAYMPNKKKGDDPPAAPHGQIFRKVEPIAPIEDFTCKNILCERVESQWDADAAGLMVTLPKAFFPE